MGNRYLFFPTIVAFKAPVTTTTTLICSGFDPAASEIPTKAGKFCRFETGDGPGIAFPRLAELTHLKAFESEICNNASRCRPIRGHDRK